MKSVWIGDTHMPFFHKPTFSWALDIIKSYKPDVVGQIGDLYDFYSQSRFPKKPGFIDPETEILEGRKMAEEFWRLITLAAPKAQKYQIKGNHCDRPVKLCAEKAPELAHFVNKEIKRLYEFPGVTTVHDSSQELVIGDIMHIHGYLSKLGDHCKYNLMKVIHGHTHRPGTFFFPMQNGQMIWEADTGHMADTESPALQYRPQKYTHWGRGLLLTDDYGPRFMPAPPK